jgi:hypothetical protein
MSATQIHQSLQIENGRFYASEAHDVLHGLFKEQINFHKIQRLRAWERYHQEDTSYWDKKIEDLKADMQYADQLIAEAKKDGLPLEISFNIQIKPASPAVRSAQFEMQEN